jgi:hypothetical protein
MHSRFKGTVSNECLAISEVFALAEEHFATQVIIAADIEEKWTHLIQQALSHFAFETRFNRERGFVGSEPERRKGAVNAKEETSSGNCPERVGGHR